MNRIKSISDAENLNGKRVFVRVDFNVPIKNGVVQDDTRIRAALPTLEFLISKGAKVICASHLGRPKSEADKEFSLEPVAAKLGELLNKDVLFSHETYGTAVTRQSKELKEGNILVIENLRFHQGEKADSSDFAAKLAQLCDIYVNDAFGVSHRADASVDELPRQVSEKFAGLLLEKEIQELNRLIQNPVRPLVSILGGAKVSDKVKVIEALSVKSSKIIIGGAMAYTFLRALKVETGNSLVEVDKITLAKNILDRAEKSNCKILLPVDHIIAEDFNGPAADQPTTNAHIPEGFMGMDIGPKTRELYTRELQGAKSIFWNGPMGVFEKEAFAQGTLGMAKAIAECDAEIKICGGGDSVSALNKSGYADAFTHISTGGGASLEMIEGAVMPGIESLRRKPS